MEGGFKVPSSGGGADAGVKLVVTVGLGGRIGVGVKVGIGVGVKVGGKSDIFIIVPMGRGLYDTPP
jgi:hypothetical protein